MSLVGWETSNRILLDIKQYKINETVYNIPLLFQISDSLGDKNRNIAYIFDALATNGDSYVNRKKIAVSQYYEGKEVQLPVEIEGWNHLSKQAILWFKPKAVYSNKANLFYFYYDKNKEDNNKYIEDTISQRELTISFEILGEDVLNLGILYVNNVYKHWYLRYINSMYVIYLRESLDLNTWVDKGQVITDIDVDGGVVIYDRNSSVYKIWYSLNNTTWSLYYAESEDGVNWENTQLIYDCLSNSYTSSGAFSPCILVEDSVYHMWFSGYDGSKYTLLYMYSIDGKIWNTPVVVLYADDLPYTNVSIMKPTNVCIYDGRYNLCLDIYDSTYKVISCYSDNKYEWYDFSRFSTMVDDDLEGQRSCINTLVEDVYHLFWAGKNGNYKLLYKNTLVPDKPTNPAQAVWHPLFFSVHHLKVNYGFIDSTHNHLNKIADNNLNPVDGVVGTSALGFSTDSYLTLGYDSLFDVPKSYSLLLFAKFTTAGAIFNKAGCYSAYFSGNTLYSTYTDASSLKTIKNVDALTLDWSLYNFGKNNSLCLNTHTKVYNKITSASCTTALVNNTNDFTLGDATNSFQGYVDELWFAERLLTNAELSVLELAFNDTLFTVGDYFIQGYTTLNNKVVKREVVVYDNSTGALVGATTSDPTTGYYYLNTTYSGITSVIGIDGDLYNHYILGKVIPKSV
jgi:hypothetical protein